MPIVNRYDPARAPWPIWAVVASLFRGPGDRGVGDTLKRELGGPKSERFKAHHEVIFGLWPEPCGCAGKVAQWNRVFGYDRAPDAQPGETGEGRALETQGDGAKGGI
jgi:hypothetical protein